MIATAARGGLGRDRRRPGKRQLPGDSGAVADTTRTPLPVVEDTGIT
jgi:hypothetical protein